MNLGQELVRNKRKFEKNKIDNASSEAESILAYAINKPREFIFTHPEHRLSIFKLLKNRIMVSRRVKGIPLNHLIGSREFYGLDFLVNRNVLIPRPETELMIDEVLKINNKYNFKSFIDIGTGSGCIIITLAKLITNGYFWGLDISNRALKVAKKNTKKQGLRGRIKFIKSNLMKELMNKKIGAPMAILANLPYLTSDQIKNSPSIKKEPKLALFGGDDGLEFYHLLFKQVKTSSFHRPIFIFCEIDSSQRRKISNLIEQEFPSADYSIKKDFKGLYRLAIIKLLAPKEPSIRVRSRS